MSTLVSFTESTHAQHTTGTDYISVLRTLRWTTIIIGEFSSSSRGENDEKDAENNLIMFEDEDRQRRLRVLFGDLDRLGTGYIDRTTIHSVFNTLSDRRISNKMMSKLLQRADGDGDGRVNFEDFESSLMRDNASSNMTRNVTGEDDPVRVFRVSTRDVQRVQRRLIAAYAKDAESKAVRTVTKWVRSLMLSADDTTETQQHKIMSKYEASLREVEDKILRESENGSNYELATSLVCCFDLITLFFF